MLAPWEKSYDQPRQHIKKQRRHHFANESLYSQFSSVQSLSHVQLFATPWTAACQPPCPLTTPGVYSNSCPLSLSSIGDAIQPSHPLSSPSLSFPASGSFQMSQVFASGGQSIAVSVSASILPMNIQDWFPLGLLDLFAVLGTLKGLL